jgi:hypothetical protein
MGFIVSQSIETFFGDQLDSFYVRIENYQLDKLRGAVGTTIGHYETPETAALVFPKYAEDTPGPYGRIPVSMSYNGEWKEYPMWYNFPVTASVLVTEPFTSSSFHTELVDYIDFDENGDEVVRQREEQFETITSGSREVQKTLLDIQLITGSIYEYSYAKVKEVYSEMFGSENIIDEI